MKMAARLLLACLPGLALALSGAGRQSATEGPVTTVVNLLKDLKAKVEQDAEEETKTYNKFACWCKEAMGKKADAIEEARNFLRVTGQQILTGRGKIATLTSELEELAGNIEGNEKMTKSATALRQKANADHAAQSEETKQALASVQAATELIVKGASPSLLQEAAGPQGAAAGVEAVLRALPAHLGSVPGKHLALLSEYVSASHGSASGYQPQSDTVRGILQNMYATFASDLEESTNEEAAANREFENLMDEQAKGLQLMQKESKKKDGEKAEAESLLADNNALYDDTEEQRKADIDFFDGAKAGCLAKAKEWQKRVALRREELKGFTEALDLLTGDEVRKLFAKAIKPGKEVASFLQVDSHRAATERAYRALRAVTSRSRNLKLARLAVRVREAKHGHYDEVIKAIDEMRVVLKEEAESDIKKRDFCKQEYQTIAAASGDMEWRVEKHQAKIDKLTKMIEGREADLELTGEQIAATGAQMEEMTKQRSEENGEFKKAKEDDEESVKILSSAKEALTAYYRKNKIAMTQGSVKGLAAVQEEPEFEVSEFQAPDADFSSKGSHKGESKNIVSFMTMIIEDLGDEIKNGVKAELAAQEEYVEQMKKAEKLVKELQATKVSLEKAVAGHRQEKKDEEEDKASEESMLSDVKKYKDKLKPDCDWILGAFDTRRKQRTSELDGLRQAQDSLVGAGSSLVQKPVAQRLLR